MTKIFSIFLMLGLAGSASALEWGTPVEYSADGLTWFAGAEYLTKDESRFCIAGATHSCESFGQNDRTFFAFVEPQQAELKYWREPPTTCVSWPSGESWQALTGVIDRQINFINAEKGPSYGMAQRLTEDAPELLPRLLAIRQMILDVHGNCK